MLVCLFTLGMHMCTLAIDHPPTCRALLRERWWTRRPIAEGGLVSKQNGFDNQNLMTNKLKPATMQILCQQSGPWGLSRGGEGCSRSHISRRLVDQQWPENTTCLQSRNERCIVVSKTTPQHHLSLTPVESASPRKFTTLWTAPANLMYINI